jgi:hypothetical protein
VNHCRDILSDRIRKFADGSSAIVPRLAAPLL